MRKQIKCNYIQSLDGNDIVCYVCNKKIKETQRYYAIGKKDEIELYRHIKCKPYNRKMKKEC